MLIYPKAFHTGDMKITALPFAVWHENLKILYYVGLFVIEKIKFSLNTGLTVKCPDAESSITARASCLVCRCEYQQANIGLTQHLWLLATFISSKGDKGTHQSSAESKKSF